MTPDAMKELYRRYIAEVWIAHRPETMEQFFTADHLDLDAPPGQAQGLEELRRIIKHFQAAFPDCTVAIDDLFVDGETLIALITFSGTHHGVFFDIPPTGRAVRVGQIHVLRLRDGKFAVHRGKSDDLLMLRQIGVIPEMAPAPH
jgi:predicted ester cyclase